jgi:hypothetical protein
MGTVLVAGRKRHRETGHPVDFKEGPSLA